MTRNLIPTPITNKNGVRTTVHKKPAAGSVSLPQVPPPSLKTTNDNATASTQQKRWRVNTAHWSQNADSELVSLCKEKYAVSQSHECSDAEAYDTLTAIAPQNVLPLLSIGIRSAEQAQSFLENTCLNHLTQNHQEFARQAITRELPARYAIGFAASHPTEMYLDTTMDAIEVTADRTLRKIEADYPISYTSRFSVEEAVLRGLINLHDLRAVSRHMGQDDYDDTSVLKHLGLLKSGKLTFDSAASMNKVISYSKKNDQVLWQNLDVAGLLGTENMKSMSQRDKNGFGVLTEGFRNGNHTVEQRLQIVNYFDALESSNELNWIGMPRGEDIIALHDAGISVDDALRGNNDRLTVEQTIALNTKRVAPSLTKGWL